IDKQLIGAELLSALAPDEEYDTQPDWERFIRYGSLPSDLGAVDIHRVTTLDRDYRRLRGGLAALEFRPHDEARRLNDRANLERLPARVIVMKKNKVPLKSLASDLRDLRSAGVRVEDVPTLIIDDESDQASINTRRPSRSEVQSRTTINKAIIDLLT